MSNEHQGFGKLPGCGCGSSGIDPGKDPCKKTKGRLITINGISVLNQFCPICKQGFYLSDVIANVKKQTYHALCLRKLLIDSVNSKKGKNGVATSVHEVKKGLMRYYYELSFKPLKEMTDGEIEDLSCFIKIGL